MNFAWLAVKDDIFIFVLVHRRNYIEQKIITTK